VQHDGVCQGSQLFLKPGDGLSGAVIAVPTVIREKVLAAVQERPLKRGRLKCMTRVTAAAAHVPGCRADLVLPGGVLGLTPFHVFEQ
jgi:hypothetical protein